METLAPDLFGGDTPVLNKRRGNESSYQLIKASINYRDSHAVMVNCGTCGNCIKKICNGKNYYKCSLIGCSNGPATDIRKKGVCDKWRPEPNG